MNVFVQADNAKSNAERALSASLHNGNDGTLRVTLWDVVIENEKTKAVVSLATDINGNDIGVCVLEHNGRIGTYVRPDHRGNKIGERLVLEVIKKSARDNNDCYAFLGNKDRESFQFYNRLGIFVDEEYITHEWCNSPEEVRTWSDALRLKLREQGFTSKHALWNYKFRMSSFLVAA
jgi:GNAT superfamily N-acetyltransferase